jgi:uncharacterized membrane protein
VQEFYRWVGFAVCHQLPERTIFVQSGPLPICARDTGIYIGFAVSYLALVLMHRDRPTEMPPKWFIVLCGLFVTIMALDGLTSYAGLRPTTNDIRLLTGLLAGFSLPPLIRPILTYQIWKTSSRRHELSEPWQIPLLLALVPVSFVIVKYHPWPLDPLLPTIVTGTVFFAFGAVNTLMLSMIPPVERRATRMWHLVPYWAAGTVLTLVELALAAQLHAFALTAAPR